MGFWDHVNDELKKAVEDGWTAVKENARIGKLRLQIHNLHKEAEKHFKDIGGKVYESAGTPLDNPLQREDIIRLVEGIKRIEAQTKALEEEITKLKHKETGGKPGER